MVAPTLNNYEYQFKDVGTGVLLNQNASVSPFWDVQRIAGLVGFPELPLDDLDLDGMHGSFINARYFRKRTIVFEGELICAVDQVDTNIQTLRSTLIPDGVDWPLYWKHPNLTQRYYMAKPTAFDADVEAGRRTGTASFVLGFGAGDPRALQDLSAVNWSSGVDTAGFVNAGNVDGPLEVRVTANATTTASLTIANTFQFRTMTVTFPVTNGQAVVVDTNTWTVRVAGNIVASNQTPGGTGFPSFHPGNNIWRVTSNIGNGTIVAKSAWL